MQIDDLLRRFNDAQQAFLQKEKEHGATVDDMLLQRFSQEKELIEVVASKEKEINVLRKELRARDDELSAKAVELDASREENEKLDKQWQLDTLKAEMREKELLHTLAVRENEIAGLLEDYSSAKQLSESL